MSSERQALDFKSPWWGEHVHRYQEVVRYSGAQDRILDIACGTGFGTVMLAKHTRNTVTGGDISEEALQECIRSWKEVKNAEFQHINSTSIPYPDKTFDKIVSFETIEHVAAYDKTIAEFRRVLKDEGMLFISTPNFPVNSPGGKVMNPFHVKEFTFPELNTLLTGHFSKVNIYGQEYARYRNRNGFRFRIAQNAERLLYLRGFRKIPLFMKDRIIFRLIRKPMYPLPEDYRLTDKEGEVLRCKTFFAACSGKKP